MNKIDIKKELQQRWKKLGAKRYWVLFGLFTVLFFAADRIWTRGMLWSGVLYALVGGAVLTGMWRLLDHVGDDAAHASREENMNKNK